MKKKSMTWISVLLLILAGCSQDDENGFDSFLPNTLQVTRSGNIGIDSYSVTNNLFYINRMPGIGTGYIFHCNIEGEELRELVFRIRDIKQETDEFQVGEVFLSNQLDASLLPESDEWCLTSVMINHVTNGSIKLVNKRKDDDKDVLTFQINNLTFEGANTYTINGAVDYKYEGTVY